MANANPQDNEIEVITKLKTFANSNPNSRLCFTFYPNSASSYGIDSQWQAAFTNAGMATTDYGLTLEQAAERLLDRLLHPEKYVDDVD